MSFIKQGKTNIRYLLIIGVLGIIVAGGMIFYSRQVIEYNPLAFSILGKQKETNVKFLFDIYYQNTEPPFFDTREKEWIEIFAVPKLVGYSDKSREESFNNFSLASLSEGKDITKSTAFTSSVSLNEIDTNSLKEEYEVFSEFMPKSISLVNDRLVSLVYFYDSLGGVHPIYYETTLNYDLDSDKQIQLDDIIIEGEKNVKTLIEKELMEEVKTSQEVGPDFPKDQLPCSEMELAVSGFYLTNSGLVIIIEGHRLNPVFCWPSREFDFPFSQIKSILKENSPISGIAR